MSNLLTGQYYNETGSLFHRFGYHAVLGLKRSIGPRETCPKGLLEKTGDVGLWTVEGLPKLVWKGIKDPRVVTIVITALALLVTSLVFYPITTIACTKAVIAALPFPPLWAVKFAAYIYTVGLILSGACRAQGRFINKDLMDQFYKISTDKVAIAVERGSCVSGALT